MGTIGSGVFEICKHREDISVKRVLDLRNIAQLGEILTQRFEDIESDSEIDTVVELMGGVEPARTFALRAMRAGKNFVTANKLMVATHMAELFAAAKENNVEFRLGASVGGGISYLASLVRARRVDTLTSVYGIVNGTTNLILDNMQSTGAEFVEALLEAQRKGYAEANPSSDIDGIDARSKLAISMSLAFSAVANPEEIPTTGIRSLKKTDIQVFKSMGYACRFLTYAAKNSDGTVSAYVEPTLVAPDSLEASVQKNDNLIGFTGLYAGDRRFFGQGAGKMPTAQTVVSDLIDISTLPKAPQFDGVGKTLKIDNSNFLRRYYVRTKARLPFQAEALENGAYITGPTAVSKMHEMLANLRKDDPETFLAGIR